MDLLNAALTPLHPPDLHERNPEEGKFLDSTWNKGREGRVGWADGRDTIEV